MPTEYSVGIKTVHGRYLNAEQFNFELTADAVQLKEKQYFILEIDDIKFYIKSRLGKYISVDHMGVVTAKSDNKGVNETFTAEWNDGYISFKTTHGTYLSVDSAHKISGKGPSFGSNESFQIEFVLHPMVAIFTSSKSYVRVEGNDVVSNKTSQWGKESIIVIEPLGNGHWTFRGHTGKFWSLEGGVVRASKDEPESSAQFALEFFQEKIVIRAAGNGGYLSPQGGKGNLQTKRNSPTTQEQFAFVSSDPQVQLKAPNGKFVSAQEVNVMCNRTAVTDEEIFMLEPVADRWALKNIHGKYWSAKGDGQLLCDGTSKGANELFSLEHLDGRMAFQGTNGKFITAAKLGGCSCKQADLTENELFEVVLINRPQLVLKTKQLSFIAVQNNRVFTNKSKPEIWKVVYDGDGKYGLQAGNGSFLSEGSDGKLSLGQKQHFFLEFYYGKIALKTRDGKYLYSDSNGDLVAKKVDKPGPQELYEF